MAEGPLGESVPRVESQRLNRVEKLKQPVRNELKEKLKPENRR